MYIELCTGEGNAPHPRDFFGYAARSMRNLLIALALIYIVMAAIFESLLFPAAILSGVLFSVFGVFWLFWLTGTTPPAGAARDLAAIAAGPARP